MASTWYGQIFDTADLTGTTMFHRIKFSASGTQYILRGIHTKFIFHNNPTITSMTMKIYSDSSASLPKKLLYTSTNTQTKANMITLENGVREVYFTFNFPSFRGGDYYHIVMAGTGYTGSESSHIAWNLPEDPVYTTGLTVNRSRLALNGYFIALVGSEL